MSEPASTWSRRHALLHWSAAALVLAIATLGFLMSDADPEGSARLWMSRAHVGLGGLLLLVTLGRLASRRSERVTPLALAPMHRRAVNAIEGATYLFVVLAAGSGIATVVMAGWASYLGGGEAAPDLEELPVRGVHELFVYGLLGLAVAHVSGVLLHELREGGALRRMFPTR